MQSVMLGGAADPSAFMTEVGPFQYEAFRCGFHQEAQWKALGYSKLNFMHLTFQQLGQIPPEDGSMDVCSKQRQAGTSLQCCLAERHKARVSPKNMLMHA